MWKSSVIYLIGVCLTLVVSLPYDPYIDIPFKRVKTSAERISEHGYPSESHFVKTKDGYVLNLFRIPYSPKLNNKDEKKPVVFLQHGFFSCSDSFLLNGPDNAMAYNFADAGFDVWLGNARGNIYSRNNTKISLNHPYFWRFGWHEIGAIDMPTSIDYVLEKTGEDALHYVAHSQGSTVLFVMTSMLPEYNAKVKTAHLLAPPIFLGNATDVWMLAFAPYMGTPGSIFEALFENQVFIPYNHFIQRTLDTACGGKPRFPKYCRTLLLMFAGTGQGNFNATLLPQLAETHPAGVSTNQAIHSIQLYVSTMFRCYDHGPKDNMKAYGQTTPPDYPLEKITVPMYIYYSLADGTANKNDINRLPQYLKNHVEYIEMPDPNWSHTDFLWAMQVKEVINNPVITKCLNFEEINKNKL